MFRDIKHTLRLSIGLTFIVILFGAYTRLKDAGLGCPDWPGCYGNLIAPSANDSFSVDDSIKAWIEMIHRYIASTLGLLIIFLATKSIYLRKQIPSLWIYTSFLVMLVILQGLLGMWTVTLKLNPLVVMGHLMGGVAIICLLWWIALHFTAIKHINCTYQLKILTLISFAAVLIQIALGGWTSANYAAVVCADFPTCQGQYWPTMDWSNAFALPSIPLENAARVTIQMSHRLGALIATVVCCILCFNLSTKQRSLKRLSVIILFLLTIQIILGITNVLGGLPLAVSVAHNATAVLLALSLLTTIYIVNVKN